MLGRSNRIGFALRRGPVSETSGRPSRRGGAEALVPMDGSKLYHLALAEDWDPTAAAYRGSTLGRSFAEEGFVHCSTAEQLQATADRFYTGRSDVLLLTVDPRLLTDEIRIEGGFPHLYGPLPTVAVVAATRVPIGPDGRLQLAALLSGSESAGQGHH